MTGGQHEGSVLSVAGWKPVSTVDVKGSTSFTVWLCGCNLRCPFCHNWMVADALPGVCREVAVEEVLKALEGSRYLVDYVHVTGGEPLLQADPLLDLLRTTKSLGLRTSLNSNLTLPERLEVLVDWLDHVATDAKIPSVMYGVPKWEEYYRRFLRSLRHLSERGVAMEIRVPLVRAPELEYEMVLDDIARSLAPGRGNFWLVPIRVFGSPVVRPRDPTWCERFCLSDSEYREYVGVVRRLAERFGLQLLWNS